MEHDYDVCSKALGVEGCAKCSRVQGLNNEHDHYYLAMATMKQAQEQYHLEPHMYQPPN
jgi:hypothetical protein